jgi:hypothetical protein
LNISIHVEIFVIRQIYSLPVRIVKVDYIH